MGFSNRLNNFSEYIFFTLAKKTKEIEKKTNRKVFNLSIGSPDFPPSKKLINKLKQFISEPNSHLYPGYGAIAEFSQALINWYKTRFSVNIDENELYPLLGAKDGVNHLTMALVDQGDEVLIPDPGYPAFTGSALLIGAKPIYYDLVEKNNYSIDISKLRKKLTTKTKFIWINFPSNPSGKVADVNGLKDLVDFAKQNNIWIIYDNCYSEITYDGYVAPSILQIKGAKDVAVEINSFSKTFSLAGFRIGWAVGNRKIIKALAKIKSQTDSGMSIPLQKLGAYALDNFDISWHKKMIASYEKRRDILSVNLKKLGLRCKNPKGGLYFWLKIPDNYDDSTEYCFELLENKKILVAPGTAFGKNGEKFVRISFCSDITNINRYF